MIRLNYSKAPSELTDEVVIKLTARYMQTKDPVWNKDYIKNSLSDSSHHKCAYCETKLDEEAQYLEVEHFRCKRDFPELVVQWENLLPSCKRCNGRKRDYNVERDGEIINPYKIQPSDHVYLKDYRLKWKDDIGKKTITAVYLNDTDRLIIVRTKVGSAILNAVEKLRELAEEYIAGPKDFQRIVRITRGVEELLLQAQPQSEFSAVAATVLLDDADYKWIVEWLKSEGLWTSLDSLHNIAETIKLT